jgi:hypothetical protein
MNGLFRKCWIKDMPLSTKIPFFSGGTLSCHRRSDKDEKLWLHVRAPSGNRICCPGLGTLLKIVNIGITCRL